MLRLLLLFLCFTSTASYLSAQERYEVKYHLADKDTSTTPESLGLRSVFSTEKDCFFYMENLVNNRKALGFLSFSIDSIRYSSSFAEVWAYVGDSYKWANLFFTDELQQVAVSADIFQQIQIKTPFTDSAISRFQETMLIWLENNGYPFASIKMDSIQIHNGQISGRWSLNKGPLYKIDSIHIEGNLNVSNQFLQQYLGIKAGSIYDKSKLVAISSRLRELSFLDEYNPWDMNLVGTGSTLNLYLNTKRSNQINALIGFLPSNSQVSGKTLITGEVNMQLKNAIGSGELIGVNWQQLQVNSPRLNVVYQHPFLFKSSYGIDLQFDLFKKDSSFLNLNAIAGLSFQIDHRQRGKVFYQRFVSNIISVDTNTIKKTKMLPEQLDVRSSMIGAEFTFSNTDYIFNPRKGSELTVLLSAGLRGIIKNSFIVDLKKDNDHQPFLFSDLYNALTLKSYVVRNRLSAAKYIQTGKQSTLKLAVNVGMIFSKGVYRNELFQIGGYKLLRGFDEESVYTDRFMVATGEYRYLIGRNAFLFAFSDLGWARKISGGSYYWGNGFGVSLETKSGILNLSYGVGKQENIPFSMRQAKIHFGFVSIF